MARTDAVVLGAGIVGTSIALHLAKRGLCVALVDRGRAGRGDLLRQCRRDRGQHAASRIRFRTGWARSCAVALKRATEANYHLSFLPQIAPWLLAYRANSTIERRIRFANLMRPLFADALAEHEALMPEAGATRYLRKEGWLKLYRSEAAFAATARERELAAEFGLPHEALDRDGALALEPALAPVFVNARALDEGRERHQSAGGDARLCRALHRARRRRAQRRCAHAASRRRPLAGRDRRRPGRCREAVVALGPWAPDLLEPLGIELPLAVKRGYHRHFRPRGNAGLTRPVVDAELGYCVAPMEQGLRLTTGAEFAARDAPPTPVQFDAAAAAARALFPLGEPVEAQPWMGSRPCFADSHAGDRPRARTWRTCGSPMAMPIGA